MLIHTLNIVYSYKLSIIATDTLDLYLYIRKRYTSASARKEYCIVEVLALIHAITISWRAMYQKFYLSKLWKLDTT